MSNYQKRGNCVPYLEHKRDKGMVDVRQKLFQDGSLVRTVRFWVQEFTPGPMDDCTRFFVPDALFDITSATDAACALADHAKRSWC
eukprot:3935840-Rhodomonas_salina.2